MNTRAIATSTFWQVASQFTMAAMSTIAVKFIAIGLTKELAGSYNSAYGFLQLFAILADFGLYAVSVREVSKSENKEKILGALITLRCAIMTLSLGSALAIAWIVPAWQGTPLPLGISIAALVPFFTLLAGVLRTVFQVTYSMHLVFIAEVTQRIVSTGLMAIPILIGVRLSADPAVYRYFLWAGGAGGAVLLTISLLLATRLMRVRPNMDRSILKYLLRESVPYGVAYLCMAFYRQFDLTLIALLRPDFALQNASYGFAGRINETAFLVPTFLLNSALPMISKKYADRANTAPLLGKTLLAILLIGALACIFSIFWATPIMRLLTTGAYMSVPGQPGADTALMLLGASQFLNGMVQYSFYILLVFRDWRYLVRCMLCAVAISLTINILFIPAYGFVAAAITSGIVHAFLALLLLPRAQKLMPAKLPKDVIMKAILFVFASGVLIALSAPLLTTHMLTLIGIVCIIPAIGGLFLLTGFRRFLLA